MRRVPLPIAVAVAVLLLGGGTASAAARGHAPHRAATVSIAQFNCDISDEFPIIPARLVADAIRRSGADVVGIEEGGGEIPQIARALRWRYYSVRMQIVSRLPLIDPPGGNGIYTFVEVSPGRVVAMENVHLPSDPYGPDWVKQGKTPAQVIALERRVRLPAVEPDLRGAHKLRARGIPVFLTGDFNSPSFRDWTPAMVGTRPGLRYALRWPVSLAVEQAGFTDSFRAAHRSPVRTTGLTWPTHRTIPGVDEFTGSTKDRIDFVYADGARTIGSRIYGEPGAPGISGSVAPWPSDHRLVVSRFRVHGAVPPPLVTTAQRLVRVGEPAVVSFHARGAATIAVRHLRGGRRITVARQHLDARATRGIGTVRFSTRSWRPGAYAAVLVGSHGGGRARFRFWIAAPGAPPVVEMSKRVYAVGEPLGVSVKNAPGERWDWLGVYRRGADPTVAYYLIWIYTDAAVDGRFALGANAVGPWPLPAGRYSMYLLRDDLYVKIAGADFAIR